MIKKLWKRWCNKVDIHNAPLMKSWSTCDEVWQYTTIFSPLLLSIGSTIVLAIGLYDKDGLACIKENYLLLIVFFISVLVIMGFCYFLNWKFWDTPK